MVLVVFFLCLIYFVCLPIKKKIVKIHTIMFVPYQDVVAESSFVF